MTTQQATFVGTSPVQFGAYATDMITKDSGYVTAKFYLLSGCCTVLLATDLRDKDNRPLTRYVQDTRCIINTEHGDNPFASIETLPEESNFSLGERVKCEAYGVEGIVSAIAFYPDSSTHIEIQPPYNSKEGKLPACISVVERLVKSLDTPVVQPTKRAADRPSPAHVPMAPGVESYSRE